MAGEVEPGSSSITPVRGMRAAILGGGVSTAALILVLGSFSLPALAIELPELPKKPEPKFVAPVTDKVPKGTRVNVVADRLSYDAKAKIATATGTVRITYGPYTLTATRVVYDVRNNRFKANGSIVLTEPNGNVLEAEYAEVYDKFRQGFAEHVRALLTNDVTITADYARRVENGVTIYERASYTACQDCVTESGNPVWQIVAKEAKHDQREQTIYYTEPRFEIAGQPVLWLPYLEYPDPTVKRRSGFLLPDISVGDAYGVGVTTPYFLVTAPNSDLTFKPMWTSKQGPVADVEWRHRLANGQYNIEAYGVHQFDREAPEDDSPWRGAVQSQGNFKIDRHWRWGWDGTLLSDRTFLGDYDYDGSSLFTSEAYVTGLEDRSYVSVQALHYQTALTEENQGDFPTVLPYVQASNTFADPVLGGEFGYQFNAYSLRRENDIPEYDLGTEQTRGVVNLNWQRQMIGSAGTVVTPFAQVRGDLYLNRDVPEASDENESIAQILPSAGLDLRWPFISASAFGQSIITPVFQIIAAADQQDSSDISNEDAISLNFDHTNLFLQDRFTGFDRYESGTRSNVGLLYTYLFDNGGFLRASVGESFHIAGENSFVSGSGLNEEASDVVGAIAYQPNENLRFTYQARVAQDFGDIASQEASASLTFDRISGSVSFADIDAAPFYGRPDHEEQIWGDAAFAVSEAWSLFGGLRYDATEDTFLEKAIGIRYYCDCMTATLAYTETVGTTDNGSDGGTNRTLLLSVDFRTIGEVRSSIGF